MSATPRREDARAVEDFSLYEQALKLAGSQVDDLRDVPHLSRREFDGRETFRFRAQVPCLEYVTLLIENALLLRTHRGGRVYAGFERLSSLEPVVDRYMRIADVSERVHVFGERDWEPPRHPNVRVVAVAPGTRLAREWFVVAHSPALHAALVAVDEEGAAAAGTPEERHFRAFKTCDPALVERLADAADRLVDASLFPSRKAS
jgi:DICT domain-containing protein